MFYAQKKGKFVGFKLDFVQKDFYKNITTFELNKGANRDVIWKGTSNVNKFSYNGEDYFKISPSCNLDADIEYILRISVICVGCYDAWKMQPFKVTTLKINDLNIEFFSHEDFCILQAV